MPTKKKEKENCLYNEKVKALRKLQFECFDNAFKYFGTPYAVRFAYTARYIGFLLLKMKYEHEGLI